jgi:hypothetical protein
MPKQLKNPLFIKNSTYNDRIVSSVWAFKTSKQGTNIRYLVWQYYRHRKGIPLKGTNKILTVADIIRQEELNGHKLEINYSDIKPTLPTIISESGSVNPPTYINASTSNLDSESDADGSE